MAEFTEDGSLVSQAPVFRPTEEEWLDPIAYICKIRGEAEPFGCCKIIPPPQFVLPFHLDREGVKLRARPQAVDKLCERGQVKAATAEFQADFARRGAARRGARTPSAGAGPCPTPRAAPPGGPAALRTPHVFLCRLSRPRLASSGDFGAGARRGRAGQGPVRGARNDRAGRAAGGPGRPPRAA